MWAATRRWFRRNRTSLLLSAGVITAGYVAGQYVLGKIQEARQRMSEERIAKDNLRRRFEQNQEDCTYTVLALLPTVRDEILAALPVEEITEQLQAERQERLKRLAASEAASSEFPSAPPSMAGDDMQGSGFVHASQMLDSTRDITSSSLRAKRSKAQLWQDMKINSIARALTLIYTLSLLTLLTRIQLNLLGRRTYLSSVVALASPPTATHASTISLENRDDDNDDVYGNDFDTNRKYLTFSWWLLHRGSRLIMERVIGAVTEVFGAINIREDLSLDTLADLIMQVRRKIEGATEEERRSKKWLEYLLPAQDQEVFVIRQSGVLDSDDGLSPDPRESDFLTVNAPSSQSDDELINSSLRRLLDETSDLIDSPTFAYVLTRILDACFSHLVDYRIAVEAFKAAGPIAPPPTTPDELPRIVEIPDSKCKLAHILPVFCKQAHAIAVGSGELDPSSGVPTPDAVPNEYLTAVDRVHDLEAFAAVIYSSNFEFEFPEAAGLGASTVPATATTPNTPGSAFPVSSFTPAAALNNTSNMRPLSISAVDETNLHSVADSRPKPNEDLISGPTETSPLPVFEAAPSDTIPIASSNITESLQTIDLAEPSESQPDTVGTSLPAATQDLASGAGLQPLVERPVPNTSTSPFTSIPTPDDAPLPESSPAAVVTSHPSASQTLVAGHAEQELAPVVETISSSSANQNALLPNHPEPVASHTAAQGSLAVADVPETQPAEVVRAFEEDSGVLDEEEGFGESEGKDFIE